MSIGSAVNGAIEEQGRGERNHAVCRGNERGFDPRQKVLRGEAGGAARVVGDRAVDRLDLAA